MSAVSILSDVAVHSMLQRSLYFAPRGCLTRWADMTPAGPLLTKTARSYTLGPSEVVFAAGSGYKLLCVITGKASAYVLSGNSAFKWDTCAPHAILRSKGKMDKARVPACRSELRVYSVFRLTIPAPHAHVRFQRGQGSLRLSGMTCGH